MIVVEDAGYVVEPADAWLTYLDPQYRDRAIRIARDVFFSSRRRHTRFDCDWSSDVCSSDLSWQQEFAISSCKLQTTGRNDYFVLEPGFQPVLEGGGTKVEITVLDETRTIDGVVTRVVEEREWKNGELFEVARNYFAICEQTKDVFYFGEDVDFYEKGKVVKHDGSWLAGQNGAKAGLMMPGAPKLKMKYYQEVAPGVAMDRAEIVGLNETCKTPEIGRAHA